MSFEEQCVENNMTNTEDINDESRINTLLEYSEGTKKSYSVGHSLDFSPDGSVFESEDCDVSIFENYESGVESVDGDWSQSCINTPPSEYDFDLTEEQALETLKYFTLSLSRANQMTKTTQDLEAVLQLLQEKEKDLELAAHIGQSLLERNKNLYKKTEALENYVNEVEERETQLKHLVTMKDKLLKTITDEDLNDENNYSTADTSSCRDESMQSLQDKCNKLEENNAGLILEALKIRQETDQEEAKEKELVYECIKELAEAKDQISHLTDEISLKAQDNVAQQEEISKLIEVVLELQNRHNMLTQENEGLHETLKSSQENQSDLKDEVTTLHEKYQECLEMLKENKREMKVMKDRLGSPQKNIEMEVAGISSLDSRGSLAQEIEESVRRDMETFHEKKKKTERVMQTVRMANSTRFPKVIKGGSRPTKTTSDKSSQLAKAPETTPFDFSFATKPRNEEGKSPPSMDDLRKAVKRLSVKDTNPKVNPQERRRRPWGPEKLQIVKPLEGSATLHKWQSLANPTMSGLNSVVPGVHVKGEVATKNPKAKNETNPASSSSELETNLNDKKHVTNENAKHENELHVSSQDETTNPTGDSTTDQKASVPNITPDTDTTLNVPNLSQNIETSSNSGTSNLAEIVKSKISSQSMLPPSIETNSMLNSLIRSTIAISSEYSTSAPITTTAKSSFVTVTTTTTSTSMSSVSFPRPLHLRSQSSENLLSMIAPFNQQNSSSTSNESPGSVPFRRQSGALGLSNIVGGLVRSSSSENLSASSEGLDFSRSSGGNGKLSDFLKNSDIAQNLGKASSMDLLTSSGVGRQGKKASFHLGDSSPSAAQLEMMGDLGGFALMSGGGNPSPPNEVAAPPAMSVFNAFSSIGGFFRRQRSKSMDNLGPLPPSVTAIKPNNSGRRATIERSLERFDQAFGPD